MLPKYPLNTPNVSYGSVQKLVITWRQSQLEIFWDLWPHPLLWHSLAVGCHPSRRKNPWDSKEETLGLVFCPPSCSHHSLPCQCHCCSCCGLCSTAWAGLRHLFLPGFSSSGKSSCLPLGTGVFSTTSIKSTSWEFILWLPSIEQTGFLGCKEIRLEFLSIFIDVFGGEDNVPLEYIKYNVIQHIFWD